MSPAPSKLGLLSGLIFASRWLQLPLYLGLILAQAVYVNHFWVELLHLLQAAFGDETALRMIYQAAGQSAEGA
ncbi:YqhA family protein, partial [Escherichia coli]|uniref:YqhA family protein n=1 Tax=Escherichia coli TaxID=562 RepID=UPI003C78A329